MKKKLFVVALLVLCANIYAFKISVVDSTSLQKFYIPELKNHIDIDGVFDENQWSGALQLKLNYEVRYTENEEPPVKTEVFLGYTRRSLYVAFKAYDPDPEAIRAHISDRDDVWNDDWLGIVLDTYNDQRRAFSFMCNPYGVQCDAVETPGNFDSSWNTIWKSEGKINSEGFVLEMEIPFSSIRFQNHKEEQVWGIDIVRRYTRKNEYHITLFPRDRNNNCYLCQTPKLVGFKGVKPGANIEFAPTVSGNISQKRENDRSGDFIMDNKDYDFGFTGKWGVTSNMTLNATYNPDFSQIESDALQIDVNTTDALRYDEKRPFFIEGSDFLKTPMNTVYTRNIHQPLWGTKLSGKEGSHSIGAIILEDDRTNILIPGQTGSSGFGSDNNSLASVVRYNKDFGNIMTLGAIATDRRSDDYNNTMFGVDGNIRFTKKDRIVMQVLGSSTNYSDTVVSQKSQKKGELRAKAISAEYSHRSEYFVLAAEVTSVDNDFRADMGYMPRVGYTKGRINGGLNFYNESGQPYWTRAYLRATVSHNERKNGELLNRRGNASFILKGAYQGNSRVGVNVSEQVYSDQKFELKSIELSHRMKPLSNLFTYTSLVMGDKIDYSNVRLGKRLRMKQRFVVNLLKNIKVNLSHTYEKLNIGSSKLYRVNVSDFQLIYQFTKRCFVRAKLQYKNYDYNLSLYENPPEKESLEKMYSQVLFSYKLNPQSMLYLGYSDSYYGDTDLEMRQINRTAFMKFGYAFIL